MVYFCRQEELRQYTEEVFLREQKRILRAIPNADTQHVGSTAVPGVLTKGDLDIQVRVKQKDFKKAKDALLRIYQLDKKNPPTKTYAGFKNKNVKISCGVQLTVIGSKEDDFTTLRDFLLSHKKHLKEYNALKRRCQGKSMKEYRKVKEEFIEKVLKAKIKQAARQMSK
jgi:GrpB-like predicted nucleotidyltransferase (UPF0157 family)